MNQTRIMVCSLFVLFLFGGTASADVTENGIWEAISQDTAVNENSGYVDLVIFNLKADGQNHELDSVKFIIMSADGTEPPDISQVAVQNEAGEICGYTENVVIDRPIDVWCTKNNGISTSGTNFTISFATSSSWENPNAVLIKIGAGGSTFRYKLASGETSSVNVKEGFIGEYKWYADAEDPTLLEGSLVYNVNAVKAGDFIEISAEFSENMAEGPGVAGLEELKKPVITVINALDDSVIDEANMSGNAASWYYEFQPGAGYNCPVDVAITGTDLAGNPFSYLGEEVFLIDNGVPDEPLLIPANGAYLNYSDVFLNFTINDALSYEYERELAYELVLSNESGVVKTMSGNMDSGVYEEVALTLIGGQYSWVVTVTDEAGNIASAENIFTVDIGEPSVGLECPVNSSADDIPVYDNTSNLLFNFTVNDTLTYSINEKIQYTLLLNDAAVFEGWVDAGSTVSLSLENLGMSLPEGLHSWTVKLSDKASNSHTANLEYFILDTEVPEVSLNEPGVDVKYVGSRSDFNFMINDGGSGLMFYYELIILNADTGEEVLKISDIANEGVTVVNGAEGLQQDVNYRWYVNVVDVAGRSATSQEQYFRVDTEPPAPVNVTSAIDVSGNSLQLSLSWEDSSAEDLDGYYIFINETGGLDIEGLNYTAFLKYEGDPVNSTVVGLPYDGVNYFVAVVPVDFAGNWANESYLDAKYWFGPVRSYKDMDLSLEAGWNLVSVPYHLFRDELGPYNRTSASVFGDLDVLYYNAVTEGWEYSGDGSLKSIQSGKGYWVYTPSELTLNLKFMPVVGPGFVPELPAAIELVPGWNMIGHVYRCNKSYDDALFSLYRYGGGTLYITSKKGPPFIHNEYPYYYSLFSNLLRYSPDKGWEFVISSDDKEMHAGEGFWIFMNEEAIFGKAAPELRPDAGNSGESGSGGGCSGDCDDCESGNGDSGNGGSGGCGGGDSGSGGGCSGDCDDCESGSGSSGGSGGCGGGDSGSGESGSGESGSGGCGK